MLKKVSIGYLTGSRKAVKNHLFSDTLVPQRPFTWGQMFFKPYESPTEYIYSARHTFMSAAFLGLIIFNPMLAVIVPQITLGIVAILFGIQNLGKVTGYDSISTWAFDATNYVLQEFCQALVDLVILPLSALTMVTRGVSSVLKERGFYDYDAPIPQPLDNTMESDNTMEPLTP